MKIISKIAGALFILTALLLLLVLMDGLGVIDVLLIGLIGAIGVFLFRYNPAGKRENPIHAPQPRKKLNELEFKVRGISKENEAGEDIQELIKEIVQDDLQNHEAYEGMSKKEMCEDCEGERIYQMDSAGVGQIKLVPDPQNEYDPNAIKIYHDEIGHIGYVPKEKTAALKDILRNEPKRIEWFVIGGKYRICEDGELEEFEDTYGMKIVLKYE